MAKEINEKQQRGTVFRKYCRKVHSHLSYFFIGVILIYAVSGITMNHLKDFNPQYMVSVENYTIDGKFPHSHNFDKEEIKTLLERVDEADNYTKHFIQIIRQ